jgi:molybdate transport system substrate-binding protein
MRVAALLLMLLAAPLSAGETLRIAVAANFKPTLEKITQQFQHQSGIKITLSSASTGVLATQIQHGAPFDLFFSADRETPQKILALRAGENSDAFCYAMGSLVLAGGDGSLSALAQPGFSLAIANPATAPYGRAAMEVLARPEFKAGEKRKLVRGNSAIQTYQFWHSGAVDLALLPQAVGPATATHIPLAWHKPLEQYAVILRHSTALDAYLNWIRSDTVRALITEAGYEPCP